MMKHIARAFFFFAVVAALGLGVVSAIAQEAQPAPVKLAVVQEIFREMGEITGYYNECDMKYWLGYGIPDLCTRVPAIVYTNLINAGLAKSPNTKGVFSPYQPTVIYVDTSLDPDSDWFKLAMAHEMVHYMQWRAGKITMKDSCLERVGIEVEAYEAANKWLVKHGKEPYDYSSTIFSMHATCSGY